MSSGSTTTVDRRKASTAFTKEMLVSLINPITREKIVKSLFWLQKCAVLDVLGVAEAAIDLEYVGCLYGEYKLPAPYLCLLYRLLELAPDSSIVMAMASQDIHKYLRVLAMHYLRVVVTKAPIVVQSLLHAGAGTDEKTVATGDESRGKELLTETSPALETVDVRVMLHELMDEDYRKLRCRTVEGQFVLSYVDVALDILDTEREFYGLPLPTLFSSR